MLLTLDPLLLFIAETNSFKTQVSLLPFTHCCFGKIFAPPAHALLWGLARCPECFHPFPLLLDEILGILEGSAQMSPLLWSFSSSCVPHVPLERGREKFVVYHHLAQISTTTHILVSSIGKQQSVVAMSSGLEPKHIETWTLFSPVICWEAFDMFTLLSRSILIWKHSVFIGLGED